MVVGLAVAGACGDNVTDESAASFELLTPAAPIELDAPTRLAVHLFVINPPSEEVTISSPNLPAFATISGDNLVLSPQYADRGDHVIDLVATSGTSETTSYLRLHITGTNTRPTFGSLFQPTFVGGYTSHAPYPQLRVGVCDRERQAITVNATVRSVEGGTQNPPVFTSVIDFAAVAPIVDAVAGWCADVLIDMPGLSPGRYAGLFQLEDAEGLLNPDQFLDFAVPQWVEP